MAIFFRMKNNFYIFAFFLFAFGLFGIVHGWKLRDLAQKGDENKISSKRPIFRDLTIKKMEKVVTNYDDVNENDKENQDENNVNDDDEDDDDDDHNDDNEKFVFEKVRSTHFDIKPKPKIEQHLDADDDDEEENNDTEKQEPSLFDSILSYFPFFTNKDDSDADGTNDSSSFGIFSWLTSLRQKEMETEEKPPTDGADELSQINWLAYLDRKPFNIILYYFREASNEEKEMEVKSKAEDEDENKKREPLTTDQFESLLLHLPSFVPNYSNVENIDCKRMGQIFQRQVRGQKLWALQMMDASAKVPSGLLRGNANQLGDFDLCTEIRTKIKLKDEKSIKIKGKYCLANVDVVAVDDELKLPVHLLQGRNLLRSKIDDRNNFLPRFSTLKWGLCLPSACTNEDAQQILNELLIPFNETGINIFVEVDSQSCHGKNKKNWIIILEENWQTVAAIGYFLFFALLAIVASLNDYWKLLKLDVLFAPDRPKTNTESHDSVEEIPETRQQDNEKVHAEGLLHRLLMAFSIKQTGKSLFCSLDDSDEEIVYCIYGLKGLATILLFLSLKLLQIGHLPFTNRAHLTEILDLPVSIIARASLLYTEVFLMTSGFPIGYKISKDLETHKKIYWFRRYVARLIRLTPSLVAVILFTIWIWPYLGNGPQWGNLVMQNSELCRENYWTNLLYIQNWFSVKEQCLPQLLQLSVDVQLFMLAPILVWLFYRNETVGFTVFGLLHAFSVASRYSTTISERLSYIVFHGMKLSQLFRTLDFSLASPLQRATSYFVGLGLGVMLFQAGRTAKLPSALFSVGWLATFWFFTWCFWAPMHLSNKDYIFDPNEAALYATWAPLLWSLALSWIIFVVYTRNDGIITKILTAKPLIFISRISYQIFLVQFLVLLHTAAETKSSEAFSISTCINGFEIFLIIIIAVLMALTMDLPFQTIGKMIIYHHSKQPHIENIKEDSEESTKLITNTETEKDEETQNQDENSWTEPIQRKRSFSPVWLKDEEEHEWGSEGDDENDEVEDIEVLSRSSRAKSEDTSEPSGVLVSEDLDDDVDIEYDDDP